MIHTLRRCDDIHRLHAITDQSGTLNCDNKRKRRPRCLAIQHTKKLDLRIIATAEDAGKGKAALVSGRLIFHGLHIHSNHPHKVLRITTYGAHDTVVFATSEKSYAAAPFLLNPGETVVAVGIPSDPTLIARAPPRVMICRRLNTVGTIGGTLNEVDEVSGFVSRS